MTNKIELIRATDKMGLVKGKVDQSFERYVFVPHKVVKKSFRHFQKINGISNKNHCFDSPTKKNHHKYYVFLENLQGI